MLERKETLKSLSGNKKRKDKAGEVKSGGRLEGISRKSDSIIDLKSTIYYIQFTSNQ